MNYINGVIAREEAGRFEKMVFRVAKGNVITIIEDLNVELETKVKQLFKDNVMYFLGKKIDIFYYISGKLSLITLE